MNLTELKHTVELFDSGSLHVKHYLSDLTPQVALALIEVVEAAKRIPIWAEPRMATQEELDLEKALKKMEEL